MLLNQTAEYAFRAMACLSARYADDGEPIRAQELSQGTNIPSYYLSKIMRRLVVAGLVESQRGHGGGFRLARPPGEIKFREVLDAVDYSAETGRCAFGIGRCDSAHPCPLHHTWSELLGGFQEWSDSHTLADAVGEPCPPAPGDQGDPA